MGPGLWVAFVEYRLKDNLHTLLVFAPHPHHLFMGHVVFLRVIVAVKIGIENSFILLPLSCCTVEERFELVKIKSCIQHGFFLLSCQDESLVVCLLPLKQVQSYRPSPVELIIDRDLDDGLVYFMLLIFWVEVFLL